MQKQLLLATASLLMAAFIMTPAAADTITVEVSGTVDYVNDHNNILGGTFQVGQPVSGTYTYDTNVVDQDPSSEYGRYEQNPADLAIQLDVGGTSVGTNAQPTSAAFAIVDVADSPWYDGLHIASLDNNKPLPSGASVDHIGFDFYDPTGAALASDAIVTTAPSLEAFQDANIHIGGQDTWSGGWYDLSVKISAVRVVGGPEPEGVFNLTAEVTDVYDPAGVLGQGVQVGSAVDGSYRIDTSLPDRDPDPRWGIYEHTLGSDYGFSLEIGGLNFTSDSNRVVGVHVVDSYYDEFNLISQGSPIQTATGTLKVRHIDMWLAAYDDQLWSSDALSAEAPSLDRFDAHRDLYIGGVDGTGNYWSITARVLDITKANAEPVAPRIVSPASGFFFQGQNVRAAFVLPAGKHFSHVSGTINGEPIGEYAESCYPVALLQDGREAVVCPPLSALPSGKNSLKWTTHYQDGGSDTESVEWELLD